MWSKYFWSLKALLRKKSYFSGDLRSNFGLYKLVGLIDLVDKDLQTKLKMSYISVHYIVLSLPEVWLKELDNLLSIINSNEIIC